MQKIPGALPSSFVAQRLREVRDAQHVSLRKLSERLDEIDYPLDKTTLANIETGERRITVDDLVALALVLNVSPLMLLTSKDEDATIRVGSVPMAPAHFRAWVRGRTPMWFGTGQRDERGYYNESADMEWRARERFPALITVQKEIFNIETFAGADPLGKDKRSMQVALTRVSDAVRAMADEIKNMKKDTTHGTR